MGEHVSVNHHFPLGHFGCGARSTGHWNEPVNSASKVTVTSPAGSGTVDVTVTTAGGTSATSTADRFTYIAAPTVSSISPTSGPAAGGTSVAITGTNFTGATAVQFGSTNASSFTVNGATSITATSPAGTGTVDVTVTTVGGTSATSANDQFTYIAAPTVLTPYVGLYGDYRFSTDNALPVGQPVISIKDGLSARVTSGATFAGVSGRTLGFGGELAGLGSNYRVWSANARGRVPF